VKDIGVVLGNRLRPGGSLERRDLLPEEIQHGVRRRMAVVRTPMHFAARDHIDGGELLVQYRCLGGAVLSIRHRAQCQLPDCDQPVERLKPIVTL
jgi:hypothetical protein